MIHWISKLFIDLIHILFLLYLLLWFGFPTSKPAGFHKTIRALIKDIFLSEGEGFYPAQGDLVFRGPVGQDVFFLGMAVPRRKQHNHCSHCVVPRRTAVKYISFCFV